MDLFVPFAISMLAAPFVCLFAFLLGCWIYSIMPAKQLHDIGPIAMMVVISVEHDFPILDRNEKHFNAKSEMKRIYKDMYGACPRDSLMDVAINSAMYIVEQSRSMPDRRTIDTGHSKVVAKVDKPRQTGVLSDDWQKAAWESFQTRLDLPSLPRIPSIDVSKLSSSSGG